MLSDKYDANNHPYISSMINASSASEIKRIQKKKHDNFAARKDRVSQVRDSVFSYPFSPHHQQSASHLTTDKLLPKDLTSFGLILDRANLVTAVLHLTGPYPIYPIS